MSKQSEAKINQGYTRELKTCANCKHFCFKEEKAGWNNQYVLEKELRCGIGEFKVHKTATCNLHEKADQ